MKRFRNKHRTMHTTLVSKRFVAAVGPNLSSALSRIQFSRIFSIVALGMLAFTADASVISYQDPQNYFPRRYVEATVGYWIQYGGTCQRTIFENNGLDSWSVGAGASSYPCNDPYSLVSSTAVMVSSALTPTGFNVASEVSASSGIYTISGVGYVDFATLLSLNSTTQLKFDFYTDYTGPQNQALSRNFYLSKCSSSNYGTCNQDIPLGIDASANGTQQGYIATLDAGTYYFRASSFLALSGPFNSTGTISGVSQMNYSVTIVPLPAAAWLFGSGLLGLLGLARRKKK